MAGAQAAQQPPGSPGIGPLDSAVLPPGVRSRFVDGVNGLRDARARSGLRNRRAGRRVLLLHGYPELAYSWRKIMGPLACRRLSRVRARRARLRAHVAGAGRTTATTCVRSARSTRSRTCSRSCRPWATGRYGGDRTRPGIAARRLVRARTARRLPRSGDDERAVRRSTHAAVQHGEHTPSRLRCAAVARRDLRRTRQAVAATQALPALLPDARGEREHVARRAGPPSVPARLLPHEERGLETERPASARRDAPPPSGRSFRATT